MILHAQNLRLNVDVNDPTNFDLCEKGQRIFWCKDGVESDWIMDCQCQTVFDWHDVYESLIAYRELYKEDRPEFYQGVYRLVELLQAELGGS